MILPGFTTLPPGRVFQMPDLSRFKEGEVILIASYGGFAPAGSWAGQGGDCEYIVVAGTAYYHEQDLRGYPGGPCRMVKGDQPNTTRWERIQAEPKPEEGTRAEPPEAGDRTTE